MFLACAGGCAGLAMVITGFAGFVQCGRGKKAPRDSGGQGVNRGGTQNGAILSPNGFSDGVGYQRLTPLASAIHNAARLSVAQSQSSASRTMPGVSSWGRMSGPVSPERYTR
jgi:hypothetical protein